MLSKIFALTLLCHLSICSFISGSPSDHDTSNFAFENDIRDFLEKIRAILKNGDPENDVPPMEPLPIDLFDFDFLLRDSQLKGYLDEMLVSNFSDFIVKDVQFNVIGFKLQLEFAWDILTIDGKYQAVGNVFEEIADGEGNFQSVTNGLDLKLLLHLGSNFNRTTIKELLVDFSFDNDLILFTNNGQNLKFANDFLQPLLYRIRDEYFPLLLNTLTLVGSDVVHDYTLDEIVAIILEIIQGKGLELIRNEVIKRL